MWYLQSPRWSANLWQLASGDLLLLFFDSLLTIFFLRVQAFYLFRKFLLSGLEGGRFGVKADQLLLRSWASLKPLAPVNFEVATVANLAEDSFERWENHCGAACRVLNVERLSALLLEATQSQIADLLQGLVVTGDAVEKLRD